MQFRFNPPNASHFRGTWEREVRSIKTVLPVTLGAQMITDEVSTLLIKLEGIESPDPMTENLLLIGWQDASLPQTVYGDSDLFGSRRLRHSQILADHF